MKKKFDLHLAIKKYFMTFFENNFSIIPTYYLKSNVEAVFEITIENSIEQFIVGYGELFQNKTGIYIRSTANPSFLDKVFAQLFRDDIVHYKNRLNYIVDNIYDVNSKFKFFSDIYAINDSFLNFKSAFDKQDEKIYYKLGHKRYLALTVNDTLYDTRKRKAHFLTASFHLDFNSNTNDIEYLCQLTTNSFDQLVNDFIVMSDELNKFEKSVKKVKKQMTLAIRNELFDYITESGTLSLNQLYSMSEDELKPYVKLVSMMRI